MCCHSHVIRAAEENTNTLTDQTTNQKIPFKFLKLYRESMRHCKLIIIHETIMIVHNFFYCNIALPEIY
jgi:hypothetical protein